MVVRRNRPESVMTLKRYPTALLLRVSFFVLKLFCAKTDNLEKIGPFLW